jgi:hypothetical protein
MASSQLVGLIKFAYIKSPTKFVLGICSLLWALAFVRYFDHWVYFPAFPNILDSLGMGAIGLYLLYDTLKESKK